MSDKERAAQFVEDRIAMLELGVSAFDHNITENLRNELEVFKTLREALKTHITTDQTSCV